MTLTARIVTLVLVVQLALFGGAATMIMLNARKSVAAEVTESVHATRLHVLTTLATLVDTVPGFQMPKALAERLIEPRHARIVIYDAVSGRSLQPSGSAARPDPAPAWFARLIAPQAYTTQLPIAANQRRHGTVLITADATTELAEIWADARALAVLAGLTALAEVALTALVLRGGLRPLTQLSSVLNRISHGDLSARAGAVRVPDLAPLAADVDRLGEALGHAQADRARLSRQVVERGDQERKAIARDLHDEYGPCLFTLRVEAQAIRDRSEDPAARDHAETILTIADEIRRVNSTLLSGLRPMAVGQLPFATVLSDMFDDLAARHGGIEWHLTLSDPFPEPDEATALTIYRILQEGTTNSLRHANASRVEGDVSFNDGWTVMLSDNGDGLNGAPVGNGLSGMRERVALLGGSFDVQDGPQGVTILAKLPAGTAE